MLRPASEVSPSGVDDSLVVAGERADDMVAFERQVVDLFVSGADLLGVPKSVAAIYGIIFASPEPLSFAEIGERLDISNGSISQGLRVLRDVGAIRVVEERGRVADGEPTTLLTGGSRGSRGGATEAEGQETSPRNLAQNASRSRDRYEPDLELRKLVAHFLETRVEKQLKAGKTKLKALAAALPGLPDRDTAELERRLGKISDWHSKANGLLPIARTFLKLT